MDENDFVKSSFGMHILFSLQRLTRQHPDIHISINIKPQHLDAEYLSDEGAHQEQEQPTLQSPAPTQLRLFTWQMGFGFLWLMLI